LPPTSTAVSETACPRGRPSYRTAAASTSAADLGKAVQQLKCESGKGLLVGGVKLPLALAELGLIDEYEFVVHPKLAGQGPTLFAGLSKCVDLRLVNRLEFGSGAVAMRYEPRR
jgi:dihydrofolate reductase